MRRSFITIVALLIASSVATMALAEESPLSLNVRYGNYNGLKNEIGIFPLYRLATHVAVNAYGYFATKGEESTGEFTTGPRLNFGAFWVNPHAGFFWDPTIGHLTHYKGKLDVGITHEWFELTSQSNYKVANREDKTNQFFERAWLTALKRDWGFRLGVQSELVKDKKPENQVWDDPVVTIGPRAQIIFQQAEIIYYYGAVVKDKKTNIQSSKPTPPTSILWLIVKFK